MKVFVFSKKKYLSFPFRIYEVKRRLVYKNIVNSKCHNKLHYSLSSERQVLRIDPRANENICNVA